MTVTGSSVGSRHELERRLAEARERTDEVFQILSPAALHERPIPERHRLIFYLGHVEAFDWNLIARRAVEREPFHEAFDRLFAFGIDPVDGGLPTDQPSDWPGADEVRAYNARVRATIDDILRRDDWAANPILRDGLGFHVAIEHRLMHAETLAYLLHQLPADRKQRPQLETAPAAAPRAATRLRIPAGRATLGMNRQSGAFGWDNEFEREVVDVPAFSIDSHPVTNGQFLEFVRGGGYADRGLWTDENWAWKEQERLAHPGFWSRTGDAWTLRCMFDERPLPASWPAYVSHAEASAYARWVGASLPSEEQFHRAAYGTPSGEERLFPWGEAPPAPAHGNFDFGHWDPVPAGAFPAGNSAFGVTDLVGNGWEWTSSTFRPLPGFEAFPFYAGYSANFFDGKHYTMKGGSPRTAACMLRRTFRNWFQPHYPYVYAKFRCVGD